MELLALLTERPYVVAFLASFLVIAWAERGWQRALLWLASGTFLGWLMEFSSVRTGFPFGSYTYNESNFPDELFIGGVPLFASLSFAFLTYFGYSLARTFLSPLERRGADVQRRPDARVDASLQLLLLAALITTWVDTVIDPVAHLGEYWFLGDLYAYDANGVHFDVPLSNYAGWLFTSAVIVFVNQHFDAWLRSKSLPARGFHLPFKPFWALGSDLGNIAFMLGVTVYLLTSDGVPSSVPVEGVLASGLALSGLFLVFAAVMVRRGLAREALAPAY
ncbi:MAG: carotenoid biosynthesis protein [Dehalococcoidia bacterium]|nr:carotenoid biosynthesis protein [Dehalococcoidia bacterium]